MLPNYGNLDSDRFKRQTELENLLHSLNYIICRVDETKSKISRLVTIGSFDSMSDTNYVFVPSEKIESLTALLLN